MNHIGCHRALRCAALALCAAALALAGCGPGLGGTGTGATPEEAMAAYGASEVPVCTADFADLLDCTPAGAGAAPLPAAAPRRFAEAAPASRTLLELSGQEAQWQLRCQGWVFTGTFGQVGSDAPRYFGHLLAGGTVVGLASLTVQRSGAGVRLTLVDASGGTLFGPQDLAPVADATSAAACP